MERSTSPLHVHVGKKTPVHVHIKPSRKASKLSKSEFQKLSCSEMSAGRPSLRSSSGVSPTRSRLKGSSQFASASSSRAWVPPPAKSSKARMSWEGPTHRLEINPVCVNPSGSTVLRVSDLSSEESTEILVEDSSKTIQSLQAEMDQLRTEADLQRSLRDLDIRDTALRESRASLRDKEVELAVCKEELLETELENVKLKNSVVRMSSPVRSSVLAENKQRERLTQKLLESEVDSNAVTKQVMSFRDAVRKLQRDKRFSSVYAKNLSEKKDVLLDKLARFESSNKSLRKMLRGQHSHESSISLLQEQTDGLRDQLAENEATIQLLRNKLEEQEKLAMHSQGLHDEIGYKEGEIQSLNIRLQSIEEKLHHKELCCVELEAKLREEKRRSQHDKDLLKKATRQHKDRAAHSEHTVETLGAQLDETTHELEQVKGKLMKSSREGISHQSELRTLNDKVADLEEALTQARVANKASLDSVNARLAEKTQELNSHQMENDRLQVVVTSLEGRLKVSESKAVAMDSELAQLTAKITHYESLFADYKSQLGRSRNDSDELNTELRRKEVDLERMKQENTIEIEKLRLKHQHEMAEYEPMPDMVKTTELRLKDAQERMLAYEQRASEQTRMLAELSTKSQQHDGQMDSLREKWHHAAAENKTLNARLEAAERRLVESDEHNRELMSMTSRKEETVQRLQGKVEELTQEVSSLSGQLEDNKSDSKRQISLVKDRAASKDRANLARITDLESQLNRANTLATQFRKAKEESDRRYHSRVHELQDRLDQANTTKRSLENYVNFLKSSYATVFNDSGTPGSPLSPLPH